MHVITLAVALLVVSSCTLGANIFGTWVMYRERQLQDLDSSVGFTLAWRTVKVGVGWGGQWVDTMGATFGLDAVSCVRMVPGPAVVAPCVVVGDCTLVDKQASKQCQFCGSCRVIKGCLQHESIKPSVGCGPGMLKLRAHTGPVMLPPAHQSGI